MKNRKLDYQFYGEKLKEIRKSKKLTVSELANLIDRSPRTIGSWERGERRPSSSDIKVMSDILSVEVSALSNISSHIGKNKSYDLFDNVLSVEDKLHKLFEADLNIEQKAFLYRLIGAYKSLSKTVEITKIENDRFRLIIDSIPMAIYFKDQFQYYKFANRFFSYVSGTPVIDINGKTDEQVLPKQLRGPIRDIEEKVFKTGNPILYEQVIYDDSNYRKYLSVTVIPILEDKNKIKSLIGCISDISERMNAVKNYKLLENVIGHLSSAIWVRYRKPLPHIVFLNSTGDGIFGRSLKDFSNSSDHWLKFVHPDEQIEVRKWSDNVFKCMKVPHSINFNTYRIIASNGEEKYILDKRSCFINDDGELTDFGGLREITGEHAVKIKENNGKGDIDAIYLQKV
ncbi:MAG TPA: helix-turn-helix domain-containing protein [Victivallales bacterium]|nr:helix-turn-helix domain-containing protein [Victivallales bacterium]